MKYVLQRVSDADLIDWAVNLPPYKVPDMNYWLLRRWAEESGVSAQSFPKVLREIDTWLQAMVVKPNLNMARIHVLSTFTERGTLRKWSDAAVYTIATKRTKPWFELDDQARFDFSYSTYLAAEEILLDALHAMAERSLFEYFQTYESGDSNESATLDGDAPGPRLMSEDDGMNRVPKWGTVSSYTLACAAVVSLSSEQSSWHRLAHVLDKSRLMSSAALYCGADLAQDRAMSMLRNRQNTQGLKAEHCRKLRTPAYDGSYY